MNEAQFECLPLFERRIFVIEDNARLQFAEGPHAPSRHARISPSILMQCNSSRELPTLPFALAFALAFALERLQTSKVSGQGNRPPLPSIG